MKANEKQKAHLMPNESKNVKFATLITKYQLIVLNHIDKYKSPHLHYFVFLSKQITVAFDWSFFVIMTSISTFSITYFLMLCKSINNI